MLNLYYADGDQQVGPIDKAELQALIRAKKINAGTLIWKPGMKEWQQLGAWLRQRRSQSAPGAKALPGSSPREICAECGRSHARDEMIRFKDSWVCAACKPLFIQKIKEGVPVAGAMDYAGFWIRFAAIAIDGLILWLCNLVFFIPLGMLMPETAENPFQVLAFMPLIMLLQYAIPAAYDTWFVGKYGATPGKMACKLKIVVSDGSPVSYMRAFGRHFAKWISAMILAIGYIMAAFDAEKRTLHDRICETRVIQA